MSRERPCGPLRERSGGPPHEAADADAGSGVWGSRATASVSKAGSRKNVNPSVTHGVSPIKSPYALGDRTLATTNTAQAATRTTPSNVIMAAYTPN